MHGANSGGYSSGNKTCVLWMKEQPTLRSNPVNISRFKIDRNKKMLLVCQEKPRCRAIASRGFTASIFIIPIFTHYTMHYLRLLGQTSLRSLCCSLVASGVLTKLLHIGRGKPSAFLRSKSASLYGSNKAPGGKGRFLSIYQKRIDKSSFCVAPLIPVFTEKKLMIGVINIHCLTAKP